MNKLDSAIKILNAKDGIAKTSDFLAGGLSYNDISSLTTEGSLFRIRQGYYALPNVAVLTEEQVLGALLPQGVICVESALFHYGYSDFTPRVWSVAVPRTITRPKLKIDGVPMKVYYIADELYNLGKTTDDFNGITLSIYDRERTICDCFKYRTKLDNELFNKAVHSYIADDSKNLRTLSLYAQKMRVSKKVTELMEVLLNG